MTRRLFISAACVPLAAQTDTTDASISYFEDGTGQQFSIIVSGGPACDWVLVRVFYKMQVQGVQGELLLSKSSFAPWVDSKEGAGMTNDSFSIARNKIQFVDLTFLTEKAKVRIPQ
jgi:hypothetical protein